MKKHNDAKIVLLVILNIVSLALMLNGVYTDNTIRVVLGCSGLLAFICMTRK